MKPNLSIQKFLPLILGSSLLMNAPLAISDEPNPEVLDNLQGYFEFASFGDGVLTPALVNEMQHQALIIDTRKSQDYAVSHIPNAIHIEWRDILNHLDELPKDKMIILYCDTGILSSKAHMALRLLGYENARVMFGGYLDWLKSKQN
ncbi:rhodanese-like domain-containing protein [Thiosulfativibrio zosterae]|uniref:Rhodanese domain-containing protein n=1 Tax=Thiosulfativibrio zosterae TaxID=2675053 RepID=A0A6F8PMY2_9GAMM|nr:rhodanese-like domain-containing protein [Thiosulfativibrio zosterae]BBP43418.1 hypothetical protein THMIRHAT_11640 [Thiosulfativibrio zosterae]